MLNNDIILLAWILSTIMAIISIENIFILFYLTLFIPVFSLSLPLYVKDEKIQNIYF